MRLTVGLFRMGTIVVKMKIFLTIVKKQTSSAVDYNLILISCYLGVRITNDLCLNTHINQITGKANCTLGFVKRNVCTKNQYVKELAYKS